jgi:hypothetical protein
MVSSSAIVPAAEVPDIDNVTIINPATATSNDGGLLIQASGDGTALQYRILGLTGWQSDNVFNGLDEGTITLQVRYLSQNCIAEEIITLVAGGGVVGTPSETQICSEELNGTNFLETYYIPIPDQDLFDAFEGIANNPGAIQDPMFHYNSIGIVEAGTIIYFDHWEDGYEANPEFPVQGTSKVWGDGDVDNGFLPSHPTDIFQSSDIIILDNQIDLSAPSASDYDAGDKFVSRGDLAYTRMGWADNPGSFLGGAAEVYAVDKWGLRYDLPVGENVTTEELFQYTAVSIQAGPGGSFVTVDDNGTIVTRNLIEGESWLVENLDSRTSITGTNPIHVVMLTGDVGSNYESRFFTLTPTDNWSSQYYNPVSTPFNNHTRVFMYNPGPSTFTISAEDEFGIVDTEFMSVGETWSVIVNNNRGSKFYSSGDEPFYAIAAIDTRQGTAGTSNNGQGSDWGYALIPYEDLSGQITLVGFAPGDNPVAGTGLNGAPIWITADHPPGSSFAGNPIGITVDYNNGAGPQVLATEPELGQWKLKDWTDNDATGTKIWVSDGSDAFIQEPMDRTQRDWQVVTPFLIWVQDYSIKFLLRQGSVSISIPISQEMDFMMSVMK